MVNLYAPAIHGRISTNCYWYTLFTTPKHEKIVYRNLMKKGMTVFLPLRNEIRQWKDRKQRVNFPLFPNYLFVNIAEKDRYKVFEVPGVIRFLDSNAHPTVMQESEIELIKKLLSQDAAISNEPVTEGEHVIVTSGHLKDVKGVMIGKKGSYRLLIEIQSLSKNLTIDISNLNVRKVQQQEAIVS